MTTLLPRNEYTLQDPSMSSIVLVTGGSGFVGQHVIGLLQKRASHVTEIRNLDLNPFENTLDYDQPKPVKQYIGSITDSGLVRRACQGVASVIHVAGLIDVSMFPNTQKLELVNITGTSVLLDACREAGVKRFVFVSSMSAISGFDDITDGTEDSVPFPDKLMLPEYGLTKRRAEQMVLASNCEDLRTVAIRPSAMYGENDELFISTILDIAQKSCTGKWRLYSCRGAKHQMAYVGNVAWMLICAEKSLSEGNNKAGGNAFFAADDTPCNDVFEMREPFLSACNYKRYSYKLPLWLPLFILYLLYFVMLLISPFKKVNIPFGIGTIRQMLVSWTFKYDKAKKLLNYRPLYSYEESVKRSMVFYKKYAHSK